MSLRITSLLKLPKRLNGLKSAFFPLPTISAACKNGISIEKILYLESFFFQNLRCVFCENVCFTGITHILLYWRRDAELINSLQYSCQNNTSCLFQTDLPVQMGLIWYLRFWAMETGGMLLFFHCITLYFQFVCSVFLYLQRIISFPLSISTAVLRKSMGRD